MPTSPPTLRPFPSPFSYALPYPPSFHYDLPTTDHCFFFCLYPQVKPDDRTNQISNILGSFEQVAPIMRSERARNSLVGAFAMPCTPAPVHQDHDHLFGPPPPSPLPPPPPPPPPVRQERRPEQRSVPGVGGHERRPFQAPAPPPPPQPMATSAMLAAMTMSQQRHAARPGAQRIEKVTRDTWVTGRGEWSGRSRAGGRERVG